MLVTDTNFEPYTVILLRGFTKLNTELNFVRICIRTWSVDRKLHVHF